MEYIIEGIVDEENNKSAVYGATPIKELGTRLIMYEEQKCRRAKSTVKLAKTEKNKKPDQSRDVKKTRCCNCGDKKASVRSVRVG